MGSVPVPLCQMYIPCLLPLLFLPSRRKKESVDSFIDREDLLALPHAASDCLRYNATHARLFVYNPFLLKVTHGGVATKHARRSARAGSMRGTKRKRKLKAVFMRGGTMARTALPVQASKRVMGTHT